MLTILSSFRANGSGNKIIGAGNIKAVLQSGKPVDQGRENLYLDSSDENALTSLNEILITLSTRYNNGNPVTVWIKGDYKVQDITLTGNYDVQFKAYPGENPVLYGYSEVNEFTDQGGNIWRSPVTNVTSVLVDGSRAPMATDGKTYSFDSFSKNSPALHTITSEDLTGTQSDDYFNNCYVDLKYQAYRPVRIKVLDYIDSKGELIYSPLPVPDDLTPGKNHNFQMQLYNHMEMMDSPNEWVTDSTCLFIYSEEDPNVSAGCKTVREISTDYGMKFGSPEGNDSLKVSFDGISFYGFGLDGIHIQGIWYDSYIKNCRFTHCTRNGVTIRGNTAVESNSENKIHNNYFTQFGSSAILAFRMHRIEIYNNGDTETPIASYDTNEHLGYRQVVEIGTGNLGDAIHIWSFTGYENVQAQVCNNYISRSMKNGIQVSGRGGIVEFNDISGWGRITNDVGGFYTSGTWSHDMLIRANRTYDGNWSNLLTDAENDLTNGIYIDNRAHHCIVKENESWGNSEGIHLSYGANSTVVHSNILRDNRDHQLWIAMELRSTVYTADSLSVKHNTMMCLAPEQNYIYYLADFDYDKHPFHKGEIDSNEYISNSAGKFVPALSNLPAGVEMIRMKEGVSLQVWRSITRSAFGVEFDKNSVERILETPEFEEVLSASEIDDDFGWTDIKFETSEVQGNYGGTAKSINLSGNNVVPHGKGIHIKFSASASANGVMLGIILRDNSNKKLREFIYSIQEERETYELFWRNKTGKTVDLGNIWMRIRGFNGTPQSIIVENADFLVERGLLLKSKQSE